MTQSRNGVIEVAVVEGIARIPREDWNALLSDDDSPFVDWDWLHAMEASRSATRNTGWAPYHLVIRDSGKKILAACPLYLKTHSMGEFVFDHGWAEAAQRSNIKLLSRSCWSACRSRLIRVGDSSLLRASIGHR